MTKKILLAALLSAALIGCTISQQAAIDVAIKKGQMASDSEAKIILATLCAIREGAKQRLLKGERLLAVQTLCAPR